MKRTAILNVVGLSRSVLGSATPHISSFAQQNKLATISPALPAVTCTAQANYLTGCRPTEHGIVGNGWYDRSLAEVQFWKQSNHLIQRPKIWHDLKALRPEFTCAKLFWWYNMYSGVDFSITPRPLYPADGRKIFDIYTWPFSLRPAITEDLGTFPFPAFWGPAAGTTSGRYSRPAASQWIADAARWIEQKYSPTLSLVYLPHLDYNFQRWGPHHPKADDDLREIDQLVGELLEFYRKHQVQVALLSEYGLTAVDTPVHLNRLFRENGWIEIKQELGLELLDCGASRAFAVADHQIAHVYLNDASLEKKAYKLLRDTPGVGHVFLKAERGAIGLDHNRAGDLIVVAQENAWFTYYYWFDDQAAPDFARTVDIHRKPGYDPVELFLDPRQRWAKLKIAFKLLQKKLGFRMLMNLIPLDPTLVKGSHGCIPRNPDDWPIVVADSGLLSDSPLASTEVYELVRRLVLEG